MNMKQHPKIVRPDAEGCTPIDSLAYGISSFKIIYEHGCIILEPQIKIPVREKWLFENKTALALIRDGLKDEGEGQVGSKGSFA